QELACAGDVAAGRDGTVNTRGSKVQPTTADEVGAYGLATPLVAIVHRHRVDVTVPMNARVVFGQSDRTQHRVVGEEAVPHEFANQGMPVVEVVSGAHYEHAEPIADELCRWVHGNSEGHAEIRVQFAVFTEHFVVLSEEPRPTKHQRQENACYNSWSAHCSS